MKMLLALLFAVLLPLAATAQGLTEAGKIEALIASVERLPGAVFIRNGSEHDARQAAEHLRKKWKYAGKRVKTAEDFISCCASASSMSGTKYRIRFADGHSVYAQDYFREQLRRIEASVKPKPQRAGAGLSHIPI